MPRRRFDKKNAQTYQLVFRSQDDPRIHDPEASDMVFTEKPDLNANGSKIKNRDDLDEEFSEVLRDNEGEAANHGIYYDDTEYDYMQHMRDLGGSSEVRFIEAPGEKKGKGKGKMGLEDALREMEIGEGGSVASSTASSRAESVLPQDMLPSAFVRSKNYQDMQNVPDAIAGFRPDMDPRLREVLEALEDEAYVDDDEEVFGELALDGEEVGEDEWEQSFWDGLEEDDQGWESDRTVKAGDAQVPHEEATDVVREAPALPPSGLPDDDHSDGDWMKEFSKFKKDAKATPAHAQKRLDLQSSVLSGASSLAGGRKKKRKGALTSTSGYSMSSSVLARTEGQTLLDARFDKIEEEYADDDMDDSASVFSGVSGFSTTSSQAPQLIRSDFDNIMGEFLQQHAQVGKRRVKLGVEKTGIEQLDDIRKTLGRPGSVKTGLK